jgi:hypothetical protein
MRVEPPTPAARTAHAEPPARIAESFGVAPLAELLPAREGALDELQALAAHNRSGARPLQNGFSRPLPGARQVRFDRTMEGAAGLHDGGAFVRFGAASAVWGTEVRVEDAYRLRLHLDRVSLPEGTRLWVYGEDGEATPFGLELVYENALWTPSVGGPVLRLEVELPAAAVDGMEGRPPYGFVVDRVLEMVRLDPTGAPLPGEPIPLPAAQDTSCIEDLSCHDTNDFPVIDAASLGVAQLIYMKGSLSFLCTGGLLNDVEQTGTPWLLTAHHCFSTQSSASSLEATWDYRTSTCDGSAPPRSGQPMSNGSTLIATGNSSDYTLVRLNSVPPGRAFLGWTAAQAVNELPLPTRFHRIHHPAPSGTPEPQRYTQFERIPDGEINTCGLGEDDPNVNDPALFLHTRQLIGGDFGGSSGAPMMLDTGQVVGQLFGACGPAPQEGCDVRNDNLDGSFERTFLSDPAVQMALTNEDAPSPPSGTWLTTAEQPGFEFQARITPAGGTSVIGAPEGQCIVEALCVSGALAGRPEVFVKLIGPRPNGFLWVQISRFTPSEVEVWVRQVSTAEVKYYQLPSVGALSDDVSGLQDREAFLP